MDVLDIARWQFGITTVYHFLMVPLTLGLGMAVAIMQTRWVRTGDEKFLRETAYPLMKGSAEFFADYLVKSPSKGWLISGPSNSPEQGGLVMGPTMDHQIVRSLFGAQNVGVENPSWMSGSLTVMANLQLPWNRVVIVGFAAAVLVGMTLLIGKTRLGLFVRGVTQNRPMASCMGVNTARNGTYAFALGSGIAGLAGCALSQIGNVGPDLGQSYIVDSFMVVVLGGVGQLAGTVYAALGLGMVNKLLEGWTGAVLAKIAVLVFIIVFIQKRPQGIFAMKGRSAEA